MNPKLFRTHNEGLTGEILKTVDRLLAGGERIQVIKYVNNTALCEE